MSVQQSAGERVYVALGSNLGNRQQHIVEACRAIEAIEGCSELQSSSLYQTAPMGPQDQPDYLNAVCRFYYTGTPQRLLAELQSIERSHGRVKTTRRWTARPLDLDLLLFGTWQIDEPLLSVPHIGIPERSFVLWPLMELDEHLHIPGMGSVAELSGGCQKFGIRRYDGAAK